jgi:hypothetical protein
MHFSAQRWQDQLIVLIGLWLFISPVALDYAPGSAEAINAYIAGAVITLLAVFDLYNTYVWAVLLNLAVGVWVAVSPWALQVAGVPSITSNFVIVGLAVAVLALWELRLDPELHRQWTGQQEPG